MGEAHAYSRNNKEFNKGKDLHYFNSIHSQNILHKMKA